MATQRFTDRWLSASSLTPTSGRADYVDGLCPGLHLRVTVMGTRTFSVMYRAGGTLRRETIGRYPLVSLAEARERAREVLRQAQENGSMRVPKDQPRELTYGELVEAYVEKHLRPNARSWKLVRASLVSAPMHPFMAQPATSITRRHICDLIDGMVAAGTVQGAVNHLRRLNMLFNWAAGRDLIDANPAGGIKPPARTAERDRVLSDAEIAAVWKGTETLPSPYKQMYRMFLLTGQRRSEVSTMRWSEINGSTWTIPREKVKKDRPHAVPLTRTAIYVLSTLPRYGADGFVFSTTGGDTASSNFNKTKRALDEASKTSGWTIHDLRRTVRSKLAELGVARDIAERVVNHATGKIDRIYNRHEYLAEKREALERWEARLNEITRSAAPVPRSPAGEPSVAVLAR